MPILWGNHRVGVACTLTPSNVPITSPKGVHPDVASQFGIMLSSGVRVELVLFHSHLILRSSPSLAV